MIAIYNIVKKGVNLLNIYLGKNDEQMMELKFWFKRF